MAILRLGNEREAAVWSSEKYNAAIKRYMELNGFGLFSDSFHEGHLPDIIMISTWDDGLTEVWIESKSSAISLADKDLRREVIDYFKEWLKRNDNKKFELRVFATKYQNPKKWEQTLGPDLNEDALTEWLRISAEKIPRLWILDSLRDQRESVIEFFSSIQLMQVTGDRLEKIADERENEGSFSSRQMADRSYEKMEQRMQLVSRSDTIVGNYLQLLPPKEYLIIQLERSDYYEIQARIKAHEERLTSKHQNSGRVPPYAILSDSELLVLNTEDALDAFSFLNPKSSKSVSLEEIEKIDSRKLITLFNVCILNIFLLKGALIFKQRNKPIFFFPLVDKTGVKEPFRVKGDGERRITLATPMNRLKDEQEFQDELVNVFLSETKQHLKELSFGFHRGVYSNVRKFWGKYWVIIGYKRIYTSDGVHQMESQNARRLDEFFRKPMYNRSENQFRILRAVEGFVFHNVHRLREHPNWLTQLQFRRLMEQRIEFSPVRPMKSMPLIESYLDESETILDGKGEHSED